jgi:O-6-methylguanine DNA methyltransferase
MIPERYSIPIATPDGQFLARYSGTGLCALDFPPGQPGTLSCRASREASSASAQGAPPAVQRWHATTVKALLDALAGRPPVALPPLDLSCGTAFQQAVWGVLSRIRCGETLSYGEVAYALGRPGAGRAVGSACGANPVPVLVPCHRVLAAGRKLGGFSGGLGWKRLLLERENVRF